VVARNKPELSSQALAAYRRALALPKAPLPVDPVARQMHQHDLYQATETLRIVLDRGRQRIDVLDTISSDDVPYLIVSRGPALIDDWHSAVAIRKELHQLARELVE
jgi:hypothetical protein